MSIFLSFFLLLLKSVEYLFLQAFLILNVDYGSYLVQCPFLRQIRWMISETDQCTQCANPRAHLPIAT